ncbi:YcgN family cysteine cluster protein [Emcibacter sp.]|uniref:YcgN family cysteine cluster protein n=1 Tax=Emcibacter sp. TaxID=1979954 RepID=UPI003A8EDC85
MAHRTSKAPFWKTTSLELMSQEEWESLCDGCGMCCLHKLQDDESEEIAYTDVACRVLDLETCRCKHYPVRQVVVPQCITLTPDMIPEFKWLPATCAYRLVAEGKDLYPWHPLISGDPESVHKAGISVRGRVVSERDVLDYEDHIVEWEELKGKNERRKKDSCSR